MKETAENLINLHSKIWLADQLGITRPTLDQRLINGKWKKSEIQTLLILKKRL